METMLLPLTIALAVWFLTTKKTRASVGGVVEESAALAHQQVLVARASAFKEALDEIGDIKAVQDAISNSDALLRRK